MSLAYCFDCLLRTDECKCGNRSGRWVYNDARRAYVEGYRDGKEGKEIADWI